MNPTVIQVKEQCPVCDSDIHVRKDFDFPDTLLCCDDCGADFTIDLEIVLDPREF